MYKLFAENKETKKRIFISIFETISNASRHVLRCKSDNFVLRDCEGEEEWYWDGDCWIDYD